MMEMIFRIGWLFLLVALSGCTASVRDTFFLEEVPVAGDTPVEGPDLSGVSVDAKQRFVWSPVRNLRSTVLQPNGSVGAFDETHRMICAEPSPDALTALASTFAASVEADVQTGGQTAGSGAGRADVQKTLTETAQRIGKRTATIQLLRDSLYRACEAYVNGVLDSFGYGLILSRVDNLMLQLIAIESVAGSIDEQPLTAEQQAAMTKNAEAEAKLVEARLLYEAAVAKQRRMESALFNAESELRRLETLQANLNAENTGLKTRNQTIDNETRTLSTTPENDAETDANRAAARSRMDELSVEKVKNDATIAALDTRIKQVNADIAAANTLIAELRTKRDSATDDAATANAKFQAAAAVEPALVPPGVRSRLGHYEKNVLLEIVETSRGDPDAAVTGCLMWLARHPQIKNANAMDAPLLAKHCSAILAQVADNMATQRKSGAETK